MSAHKRYFLAALLACGASLSSVPAAGDERALQAPALTEAQMSGNQIAGQSEWQSRIAAERSRVASNAAQTAELNTGAQIGRMLEGLAYCIAVFLVGLHIFKKFHSKVNSSSKRNLRIIESLSLAPKTFLHLVEVNNQRLLVSSGQQSVNFIKLEEDLSISLEELQKADDRLEASSANSSRSEGPIC